MLLVRDFFIGNPYHILKYLLFLSLKRGADLRRSGLVQYSRRCIRRVHLFLHTEQFHIVPAAKLVHIFGVGVFDQKTALNKMKRNLQYFFIEPLITTQS